MPLSVKSSRAVPAIVGLVLEPDLGHLRRRARLPLARGLEVQRFRHVEREVDRVERVDRGQQGAAVAARADQIAGIDPPVGDAAADRRADLGELDVERTRLDPRLRRGQRRARRSAPGAVS